MPRFHPFGGVASLTHTLARLFLFSSLSVLSLSNKNITLSPHSPCAFGVCAYLSFLSRTLSSVLPPFHSLLATHRALSSSSSQCPPISSLFLLLPLPPSIHIKEARSPHTQHLCPWYCVFECVVQFGCVWRQWCRALRAHSDRQDSVAPFFLLFPPFFCLFCHPQARQDAQSPPEGREDHMKQLVVIEMVVCNEKKVRSRTNLPST